MFARTLRFQTHLDRIDEASKLFEEQVVPSVKSIKGYIGARFMADRKMGNCIVMTFWETEKDLLETENSRFFQEQLVKFIKFFTTAPVREVYEVLYTE
ncbi:MAG: antibiotic biosynthesis monooxygenase [Candidatus Aminicenantes bacterium]|nr:MAG: antibiotic biosynthesis monooxygenase [Candidatus Aminicenantes bacterium]